MADQYNHRVNVFQFMGKSYEEREENGGAGRRAQAGRLRNVGISRILLRDLIHGTQANLEDVRRDL